jgi:hypothetical protein
MESDGARYKHRTIRSQVGQGDASSMTTDSQQPNGFFTQEVVPALEAEDDSVREKIERQSQ